MVWHEAANRRLNTAYFVEKPDVSFMRILGCRAYPLNEIGKAIAQHKPISAALQRKDGHPKFGPRAHIGYLIGYGSTLFRKHSTNIYRIWCPGLRSSHTLATRDVTFNELKIYDPEEVDTTHLMTRELGPILRGPELPSELVEEPQGPEGQQGQQGQEEIGRASCRERVEISVVAVAS